MTMINEIASGVYVQLDIFCILIIIGMRLTSIFCLRKRNRRMKKRIVLEGWCYGLAFLADALQILLADYIRLNKYLFWGINDAYFILIMLGSYFWLMYVLTREKVKFSDRPELKGLMFIPTLVVGIFVFLAPVNGWIYKSVGSHYFMRGPLYVLFIAVPILYYAIAAVVTFINCVKAKDDNRMLYFNIGVASVVVVAGNLLQYFRVHNYITLGITLSLLIFFFNRIIKTGWEQQDEIMRFSEVMNCLRKDYTSIYYVDFKEDSLLTVQQDEYSKKKYEGVLKNGKYSEVLEYICEHDVFSADKNAFRESLRPDYVKRQLSKSGVFSSRFRMIRGKETIFVEMRFWPLEEEAYEDRVILGFLNINEMVRTERDNLDQTRAIQYMTMAQTLSEHFKSIYYVNVSDNTYTVMGMDDDYREEVASFMIDRNDFFNDCLTNVQKVVYEDDRHIIRDFFSKEKLLKVLEREKSASIDYRLYINGESQWFRAKVVREMNEIEKDTLIIGISEISDEKNYEIDRMQSQQVIKALSAEYNGLYYVNVMTGALKVYSMSDKILADTGQIVGQKNIDFSSAFTSYIKASVHPEDKTKLEEALMSFRERLSDKQKFTVTFRRKFDGEYVDSEMIVIKNEPVKDPVRSVVIGFREIAQDQ